MEAAAPDLPAPLEVEEAPTVVVDLPEIVGIVAPVAAPPLGYAPQLDESFTWSTIPELGFANELAAAARVPLMGEAARQRLFDTLLNKVRCDLT